MALHEQLAEDLRTAQRARDRTRVQIMRLLRSAIQYEELERREPADDAMVRAVLAREARRREEAIALYRETNREDKVRDETLELDVIRTYLPPELDRAAIEAEARSVIDTVGAEGPSDFGKVMGALMPRLRERGTVDGKLVNESVRALLSSADA
jgi:uncharacterized protein YqeY